MTICPECLQNRPAAANFCPRCGARQRLDQLPAGLRPTQPARESKPIPQGRILLFTFLTYGLYLFYWFYLTWRQYRQHTGHQVYPVWHALTLLVPIYYFFRFYAHARAYQQLRTAADLPPGINPWTPVLVLLLTGAISGLLASTISPEESVLWYVLPGYLPTDLGEPIATEIIWLTALEAATMAVTAGLLCHLQKPINDYWQHQETTTYPPPVRIKPSFGETLFIIAGLSFWTLTGLALLPG